MRGKGSSFALFGLTFLTSCHARNFPQYPASYREYAYVTNGESGTVSVYNVVSVRLDRELQVGANPVAVMASTTRNEVYVVNAGTAGQGSVSVLDAEKNAIAATILVHRHPLAIALAPDGNSAYVANSASNNVSVLDLRARRETAIIGTGEEPAALRVTPDGRTLVVANRLGNSVSIIDLTMGRVRTVFEGCPGASDVVVLPDSSKAFAACAAGHQIMAIALARFDQPDRPQTDRVEALLDVGRAPVQLALKPDGGEIFVSNSLSDTISEVITGTDDVLGAYLMGADPVRAIVSADNSLLYVANLHSQEVAIYAIDDGKREGTIHVGDGPAALAFSASGHLLFVVDARSGDVAVVRTETQFLGRPAAEASFQGVFTLLPAGRGPNAIAVKGFKAQ